MNLTFATAFRSVTLGKKRRQCKNVDPVGHIWAHWLPRRFHYPGRRLCLRKGRENWYKILFEGEMKD